MFRKVIVLIFPIVIALFGLWGMVAAAESTTNPTTVNCPTAIVTNGADSGAGSLRQVVFDVCDGGTVTFANDMTVTLLSELFVGKALTITRGNLDVDIAAIASTRLFMVEAAGALTLEGLTLRDGSADFGGAIHNVGTLTLTKSTLIGNTSTGNGGALYNEGRATILQTTFANNHTNERGGAVYNQGGTLIVRGSRMEGNNADFNGGAIRLAGSGNSAEIETTDIISNTAVQQGGAIFADGSSTLTLRRSNVSHNSISSEVGSGGGLFVQRTAMILQSTIAHNSAPRFGGGIYYQRASGGTLTLRNSTVSGNSAEIGIDDTTSGSGIGANADIEIINSTIVNNSGAGTGIDMTDGGRVTLTNSIVANNANADCASSAATVSHSLIADGSCAITDGVDGNLIADPLLDALADNGGSTLTHALLSNSPATDAADSVQCLATDQRGFVRDGDACDIGAFEVTAGDCTVTPDNGETVFRSVDAAAVQDAIDAAADDATIKVAGTCVGVQPVVLDTGTLTQTALITKSLTIEGGYVASQWNAAPDSTLNPTMLDADGQGRVVVVPNISNAGNSVTLSHLTIMGGDGVAGGSANFLQTRGGGIIVQEDHTITIDNSRVISNTAVDGGGIFNEGTATVLTTTIANNVGTTNGGGMVNFNSATLTVRASTIAGNQADRTGGIRNLSSRPILIENSTFSGNTARIFGSAFRAGNAATLINVTVSDNVGTSDSGALRIQDGHVLTLTNSIVANSSGQACSRTLAATVHISSSVIEDNTCGITDGVDGNIIADPLLGPLQDNGGTTLTHALFAGSSALDSADNAQCPATDQRGVARDVTCDIGAFEFSGVPTAVSVTNFTSTNSAMNVLVLFLAVMAAIGTIALFHPYVDG